MPRMSTPDLDPTKPPANDGADEPNEGDGGV